MKFLHKVLCSVGYHETQPMMWMLENQYRKCKHCGQVEKMICIGDTGIVKIHWTKNLAEEDRWSSKKRMKRKEYNRDQRL